MQIKSFFALILCIFLAQSCKKKSTETDNLFKFRDYISYTTSGRVSTTSNIQISLAKEVEGWETGNVINENLISVSPNVSGNLTVANKHALVFTPNEPLKSDTEYSVTVKLKEIYPDISQEFSNYTFQFKTITPNFNIVTNALQSYNKEWQYLLGVVKSADNITIDQAKQLVEASQGGKDLKIEWNESRLPSRQFEFKIDSINRKIEDSEILIKWNGKAIKADNSGENTVVIPGKNNFTITKIDVVQNPEQYLSINFSDPIKKQQNFDGLVTIQNSKNPKYIVDGNVLKAYPDSKITGNVQVDVFQGIKNTEGYKLKKPFSETISFEEVKPQVRLVNSGVILPNSQELKFNFEAVNLKKVDLKIIKIYEDNVLQFLQDNNLQGGNDNSIRQVGRRIAKQTITLVNDGIENDGKWKTYSADLSKFLTVDPGAIYRVEVSFKKEYSLYDCSVNRNITNSENNEDYYEDEYYEDDYYYDNYNESTTEDEDRREEEYWDNVTYRYRNYNYNWRERDNPCHDAYYNQDREISQNLLASNLGVIVKKGANNNYYFAVTNILNTNVEAAAKVTLYNYQQQEISSTRTDQEGLAKIETNNHASFAIVSKGKSKTYIKLRDGQALSLSKFDVSGNHLQRGLKGYIYGERGVWRPGDSLHLTFILDDNGNKLPKGHPVKMEVTDPNGKLAYKKITAKNINNFYSFKVPTSTENKTGNWNAKVSVGGATFYKGLKIETVKPNRLKIKVDFKNEVLSGSEALNGTLNVNWLHGAPAKNVKTEIKAKFSNAYTPFKKFKNYTFRDPSRSFSQEELNVFEGNVNQDGFTEIKNKLSVGQNAPGMLNVQFLVRAFENGGDFSMDAFTKQYAPYKSFVGLRSPKGKAHGSFYTDENQTFDIVVVDDQGKPIKRNGLEVKVYKVEWRWWWNSSYDNLSKYTSSSFHKPYMNSKINTNAKGKASFNINVPEKDGGRYLIRVYDPESGHATGRTAYFYKNWWKKQPSGDKEAAKMLVFSADKENYNVGETAKITFPSGTEGRALISIENGTEVIEHKWLKTKAGETVVDVPITKAMAPNVFVNISLLQPHATTANDLPLRLYGVIPILVEDPNTKLEPEIRMPSVLKPEEEFTVIVSEKNNKPMTYTVAMVEEGLLDLTRFKTPNAWSSFYAREALGVKTWDVFDDVVGAYSGSIDQIFAIGGDGNAAEGKNKKANRFKPVVKVLGPFTLQPGGRTEHKIKMPNYIGAVRTMVVAGNTETEAYGSTDKSVEVKKPLMVLATLPRKLSPGEKVTLPVTVFAMEPKVKNVNIKLKLSNGITIIGEQSKTLAFAKPDEQMAYFELDVSKANGINTVEVIATGNGEKSIYKVELDVENVNPITSKALDQTLEKSASASLDFTTFGVTNSNSATVEFSTMPPMDFSKRLQYLVQYPHGCVEQTTSGVFPQLYLNEIFDIPLKKKQEIQTNIENGIKRLGNFQRPNGGLSYWMGENTANDWGTSYAGHFMLEAEKLGFVLPLTFKSNWIKYQKEAARSWRPSYKTYNSDLAQAYRLYTLALAGSPDLGAMNRLKEFSEISNEAKWRLAAAYALAGQNEASNAISKTANIEFKAPKYNYYTYGSIDRNRAMALETMVLTKDSRMQELAKTLAKDLSSNRWMSTQTTAYSLLAMAKMVKANGGKSLDLEYTINGKTETINTKSAIAQRELKVIDGKNTLNFKNKQGNVVYVRVLNSGKLPLGEELTEQRGLSTSVVYKDLKGNTIDIKNLKQGQDFVATVTVSNLKNERVTDVALTQIFPSGWEIVNTRFTAFGSNTTSQARFTDIRDDRVNFYFDLNKKGKYGTNTFNVMLNASYLGTYYLPGIQAEAMYDNEFLVRTKGQWVTVEK
ncbi:Ig-like domain-containing alpha-2-macroglobulin family protein [Lacinutrix sp. 5H-3-7-4]|uniref:Ig-like domain-containing alpha-2-macroglobulin family protein n=1 Tax=Lacinutrix sp. (strain 5H-3-7-4) TaxID=983544 RepID=UPI00020A35B0|nr:Ig-like domain-containing alpha-2-macroglobulin family protein [Lacinutrix sp. 5H-3-7-4]AEH00759.1 alpha-2-macroglobulin domain protein [Lacinutrix sp. 5H-3-7-4]